MTDDEDSAEGSPRERAHALRDALADAVDAPAQQDEQAARRRQVEQSNGEGGDSSKGEDTDHGEEEPSER